MILDYFECEINYRPKYNYRSKYTTSLEFRLGIKILNSQDIHKENNSNWVWRVIKTNNFPII